MGLGAAVIGAGALGVAGSVGGALINSSAASKASAQQAATAQNALNLQQGMFNTAQGDLNPFITAGQSVLPTLSALETPGSSAATLATMPGFAFQSQYGTMAAKNALAAQGLGGSAGPLSTAISGYNQGLAGTYYTNTTNALQNFANMGSGAASSLAGNAINAGNSMAGTEQNLGTAQAAGTLGSANALAGGLTGVGSSLSNALLMNSLFGQNNSGIFGSVVPPGGTFNAGSPTGGFT